MTSDTTDPLPTDRTALLAQLAQPHTYDLAVVGGGATGLGVALDAAARGFSVVLLESHDFAKGTSSRATKLVHGGVRYLAQGNIALVREALHERTTLLANAPHLAQPLAFVMPSYKLWETPFYGTGLKMYDALAGKAGLGDDVAARIEDDGARAGGALVEGQQVGLGHGGRAYGGRWGAWCVYARATPAGAAGSRVNPDRPPHLRENPHHDFRHHRPFADRPHRAARAARPAAHL